MESKQWSSCAYARPLPFLVPSRGVEPGTPCAPRPPASCPLSYAFSCLFAASCASYNFSFLSPQGLSFAPQGPSAPFWSGTSTAQGPARWVPLAMQPGAGWGGGLGIRATEAAAQEDT